MAHFLEVEHLCGIVNTRGKIDASDEYTPGTFARVKDCTLGKNFRKPEPKKKPNFAVYLFFYLRSNAMTNKLNAEIV